jgi:hypothetical protein
MTGITPARGLSLLPNPGGANLRSPRTGLSPCTAATLVPPGLRIFHRNRQACGRSTRPILTTPCACTASRAHRRCEAVDVLDGSAQALRHAPGLRHAAAGSVRRIAVEDLRYMPRSGLVHVLTQRRQPLSHLLETFSAATVDLSECDTACRAHAT